MEVEKDSSHGHSTLSGDTESNSNSAFHGGKLFMGMKPMGRGGFGQTHAFMNSNFITLKFQSASPVEKHIFYFGSIKKREQSSN